MVGRGIVRVEGELELPMRNTVGEWNSRVACSAAKGRGKRSDEEVVEDTSEMLHCNGQQRQNHKDTSDRA